MSQPLNGAGHFLLSLPDRKLCLNPRYPEISQNGTWEEKTGSQPQAGRQAVSAVQLVGRGKTRVAMQECSFFNEVVKLMKSAPRVREAERVGVNSTQDSKL